MQVAEPAGAPAMAPFGGEHHQIERNRGLNLEPGPAACPRFIGRVQSLGHDPFVTGRESRLQESLCLDLRCGDVAPNGQSLRDRAGERCRALCSRPVENGAALDVKAVKKEGVEWDALAQSLDIELSAKAAHR